MILRHDIRMYKDKIKLIIVLFSILLQLSSEMLQRKFAKNIMSLPPKILKRVDLHQEGPFIPLADRPYLAGSKEEDFPKSMCYASAEDCDCYQLTSSLSLESLGQEIKSVMNSDKGAVLIRGLHHYQRGVHPR